MTQLTRRDVVEALTAELRGPEGPQGPAGMNGRDGVPGPVGPLMLKGKTANGTVVTGSVNLT